MQIHCQIYGGGGRSANFENILRFMLCITEGPFVYTKDQSVTSDFNSIWEPHLFFISVNLHYTYKFQKMCILMNLILCERSLTVVC